MVGPRPSGEVLFSGLIDVPSGVLTLGDAEHEDALEIGSGRWAVQVGLPSLTTLGERHGVTVVSRRRDRTLSASSARLIAESEGFSAHLYDDPAGNAVNALVKVPLSQPQFDALTSFVYISAPGTWRNPSCSDGSTTESTRRFPRSWPSG